MIIIPDVTTESRAGTDPIRPHAEYVRSIEGILKIVEIALCIIILICTSIEDWDSIGGGWVHFVAATTMITTLIIFLFHFFNIYGRLTTHWNFIEFLYYCISVGMFLIAAIVSAVRASLHPAIGAATFFTFAALVVYSVDTYFMYRAWKAYQNQHPVAGGTVVTSTTTITTYETKTEY